MPYIVLFICLLFGTIFGLYTGFSILKKRPKQESFQKDESRVSKTDQYITENSHEHHDGSHTPGLYIDTTVEAETDDSAKRSLKERLDSRANVSSLVEFNCAADGTDYSQYLHNNRDQEDDAYNVITQNLAEREHLRRFSEESLRQVQDTANLQALMLQQQMQRNQ